MLKHNGFYSCWTCIIPGEKEGRKATIFPYILDEKFGLRSDEYYEYCVEEIEKNGYEQFGGHKGRSFMREIPSPSDNAVPETFHNIVGVVQTIFKDIDKFGMNKKEINKDFCFAKLTTETKVEKASLSLGKKGPIRMAQWLNFLLFISIPLFAVHGGSRTFITFWFLLVQFAAKLNQKKKGIQIEELFKLHKGICIFVAYCRTILGDKKYWTSKMHSLLHTVSFVIRYGLFWNWSAKVFESALFPIKQAAIHSKVNAMLSVENKMKNMFSLFLFSGFNSELFKQFGVHPITSQFFEKHLLQEEKEKKTREGRDRKTYNIDGENVGFDTCSRRIHEPTGEIITIDSYSACSSTNNQFVILKIGEREEIYAKIVGIELRGEKIIFRQAKYPLRPKVDISTITNKYCVRISSWGECEIGNWKQIKEKVVCFKIGGSWFASKIYR